MDLLNIGGGDALLMGRRMRRPSMVQMIQTIAGGNIGQGAERIPHVQPIHVTRTKRDWEKELKITRFVVWGLFLLVMLAVRFAWWDKIASQFAKLSE
jgi:hypothetical protein